MNKVSKLVLVIFSLIILILGIVINLLIVNWLDYKAVFNFIEKSLTTDPTNKIVLVVTEVCMLIALFCIFLDSSDKKSKNSKDVLLQNDNGKLMISRDTIENIVTNVVKEFSGVKDSNTRIALDNENNVAVLVDLTATKDVIIKELTIDMQNRIKDAIKKTSDLEVNEVNVRIKNIVTPDSAERNE